MFLGMLQGPLVMDMISEEAMVQVDQPLPSARAEMVAGKSFRQLVMISNIF